MKTIYKTTLLKLVLAFVLLLNVKTTYAQEWQYLSLSDANSIKDITIGQNGTLYVLTSDRWISYSNDDGDTWNAFVDVPGIYNVKDIEASKTSTRIFALGNSGVAYTDDYGMTWARDPIQTNPYGIGISTKRLILDELKVMTASNAVLYRSTNNGTYGSWSARKNWSGDNNVASIKDLYKVGESIFVSFYSNNPSFTSLTKSTNEGITFTDIEFFNGKDVAGITITSSGLLLCAINEEDQSMIYSSNDNGLSWSISSSVPNSSLIIYLKYDEINDLLYTLTEEGIYRKDVNDNWTTVLLSSNLETIAINSNQEVFTGGSMTLGVKKSSWDDLTFTTAENIGSGPVDMMVISNNKLITSTTGNSLISVADINDHDSWSTINIYDSISNDNKYSNRSMAVKGNGNILVGGLNFLVELNSDLNVEFLSDENTAPLNVSGTYFSPIKMKLSHNDELLITQSYNQSYIDFSPDGGTTWGDPLDPRANYEGLELLYDFCADAVYYYALVDDFSGDFELKYSTDGIVWNSIQVPNYLVTSSSQIYTDNIETLYLRQSNELYWFDITNEIWVLTSLELESVMHFELSFDSNNRMYASYHGYSPSATDGIAFSDDKGVTWTYIGLPMSNGQTVFVEDISFDNNNVLFARSVSVYGYPSIEQGVYYFSETSITDISDENEISAISMYPNPVSDFFNLDVDADGEYKLFNIYGQLVLFGNISQGNNKLSFPSSASNGVYFISVEVNGKTSKDKIVLSR